MYIYYKLNSNNRYLTLGRRTDFNMPIARYMLMTAEGDLFVLLMHLIFNASTNINSQYVSAIEYLETLVQNIFFQLAGFHY